RTCAIAASYEAKAYGVKTGTKIYDARRMCPDLNCVLARHDVYVDYHHRIIEETVKHTPIHKIWSIDELASRLPPNKRNPESAKDVAMRIKEGIWKNIGEAINCSIGVAPNSLLAKIATDMQKPDGLVILRQEDLPGPLLQLKLTDIPGIGMNMEKRLHRAGIGSMQQLWDTSPKQARKIWGGVQGERFWYWLHGYDFEPPETNNVMIGHSRMLDPDLRSPAKARLMARRLLTKATYRLRKKGYYARTLSLGVRTLEGMRWREELSFPPLQDPFTVMEHLETLWTHMMCELMPHSHTKRFLKVSVIFHGLCKKDEITGDLFYTKGQNDLKTVQKNEALAGALDQLQQKYQKETVSVGLQPKTLAGHVGTKIAFSRVPDQEEFWS
ncbi:MAG: impB/mucB/samB family protein, partial [Pseudomonadota bacterium]